MFRDAHTLRMLAAGLAACAWLACRAQDETRAAPAAAPVRPASAEVVQPPPGSESRAAAAGNLLANPGFENGREGWSYRDTSPHWGDFEVVDFPVRSGAKAVRLPVAHAADQPPKPVKVYGVVQELSPASFPQRMGGWYRVDRWERSSEQTALYLQAVVIVWGDPRTPGLVNPRRPVAAMRNYQLRYYLTGIEEPPFQIQNARSEFFARGSPALGEWTEFDIPIREEFERLWGVVPQDYEMLSVLFEARWDNMPPASAVRADVYYDDLFFGSFPAGPRAR